MVGLAYILFTLLNGGKQPWIDASFDKCLNASQSQDYDGNVQKYLLTAKMHRSLYSISQTLNQKYLFGEHNFKF